jgi:predicted MFS family arabinose efflux permease
LFLLVLALLRGNSDGWSSTGIVVELTAAAVLLAGFVVIQQTKKQPMLPLGLFANRSFTGAQVAAFAISASFFAMFFYATIYLQAVLHMSPLAAGLVYLPASFVMFVVSGASAQLLDRISHGAMISGGLALVAAGLILCLTAGVHTSWIVLLPGLLVAGIGTGLFNPALSAVALGEAPPELSGLAAGTNDSFRNVGIALGVAALGALMPSRALLNGGDPAHFVTGFHHALLAAAVLAAAGAVASFALIRPRAAVSVEAAAELVAAGEPAA